MLELAGEALHGQRIQSGENTTVSGRLGGAQYTHCSNYCLRPPQTCRGHDCEDGAIVLGQVSRRVQDQASGGQDRTQDHSKGISKYKDTRVRRNPAEEMCGR